MIFNVNLSNPDNAEIEKVKINGIEILVDASSTATTLRFRFRIEQEMGNANYIIEGLVLIDEKIMDIIDNNSISFFVMADINIQNVTQSDGNYYGNTYDTYKITFDQPIANYISKVVINGINPNIQLIEPENIIVDDDYIIQLPMTSYNNVGTRNYKVVSIEFVIDEIIYNVILDYEFEIFIVNTGVNYIETVYDLISINPYSYDLYILQNDIDFTGINWTPINFNGVLLGNGYKLKNLTLIDYTSTERFKYAIFDEINGVINDLYIEDIFISIDKDSNVQVAGLAISNFGTINNVNVTGVLEAFSNESTIIGGIVANNNNRILYSHSAVNISNNSKSTYIGGIAGLSNSLSIIKNTTSSSTITSNIEEKYLSNPHYIGGFIGYNQSGGYISNSQIYNSKITFYSVSADSFAFIGGFAGNNHGTIINSYIRDTKINTESDYGQYVGGLVGQDYGNVSNSFVFNVEIILSSSTSKWISVGGILGLSGGILNNSFISNSKIIIIAENVNSKNLIVGSNNGNVSNTYIVEDSVILQNNEIFESNDVIISMTQIENIDFYLNILGWDELIWDFENLDYVKGLLPFIKLQSM